MSTSPLSRRGPCPTDPGEWRRCSERGCFMRLPVASPHDRCAEHRATTIAEARVIKAQQQQQRVMAPPVPVPVLVDPDDHH